MSLKGTELYEFDGFHLDVGERLLERKGKRIELTDRAFDVLSVLVRNSGRLVTKDQLLEEVWPGTFVEENSINKNISLLRKSLGAGRNDAKYIETVRGRGFRFVAKVTEPDQNVARQSAPATAAGSRLTTAAPQSPLSESYSERKQGNVIALVDWRPNIEAPVNDKPPVEAKATEKVESVFGRSKRNYYLTGLAAAVVLAGILSITLLVNSRQGGGTPPAEIRNIAVLPFKPMANESRDEAFEIGMADTLISKLSASRQMVVRPLSAVRRYNSIDSDEIEAGNELNVDAVLSGSIQRSGDKVRINVRLLRVPDGVPLWSDTFDEELTDIFSVQDAISHKVVSALNVKLNADEELQLAKRYTDNPQAYEYYLRGREHYFKITLSELEIAAEYFQKAIDADPNYALAYAWLAEALRTQSLPALKPARIMNPPAKQYAMKALELDESLPDAHVALAWIHLFYDWDWEATETQARRAIELSPNNSEAHRVYAHLLSLTGRHDEAIAEVRRARELAPLTLITATLEGQFLMCAGRLSEAEERLKKTLEIDPNFWVAHFNLGKLYFIQGKYDEAKESMRTAVARSNGSVSAVGELGYMLAKTGHTNEAMKLLGELESMQKDNTVDAHIAGIMNGLGKKDEAMNALEKAFDQRESVIAFLKVDFRWDPLRNDPRFRALMQKMNLQ